MGGLDVAIWDLKWMGRNKDHATYFYGKEILLKVEPIESRVVEQDEKIKLIFNYLKQFVRDNDKPGQPIVFKKKRSD